MKIVTPVTNNPDFIQLQWITFHKFMPVPFEMIVFNDAKQFPDYTNFEDPTVHSRIVHMCTTLGIQCINLPNDHHRSVMNASARHLDSVRFLTNYMFQNPDIYLHIDSDMFLVDTFPIAKFETYDCAIVPQSRPGIDYIWPNLFYFNIPKLRFSELIDWDFLPGTDTGGKMSHWLQRYMATAPTRLFRISHLSSCTWKEDQLPLTLRTPALLDFLTHDVRNPKDGTFWCELYDDCILHYRAGCNWNKEGPAIHTYMTEQLVKCIGI